MILLWFVLMIALFLAIARYNESNKVFWELVIPFLIAFAITTMVYDSSSDEKKDNGSFTQVCPTQVPSGTVAYMLLAPNLEAMNVTDSNPVGQGLIPEPCEGNVIPSEVSRRTRDQPLILIKPPECLVNDSSTHHETG